MEYYQFMLICISNLQLLSDGLGNLFSLISVKCFTFMSLGIFLEIQVNLWAYDIEASLAKC